MWRFTRVALTSAIALGCATGNYPVRDRARDVPIPVSASYRETRGAPTPAPAAPAQYAPPERSPQSLTPAEALHAWNDALYDGNRTRALELTSTTTAATRYWRELGGIDGLLAIYARGSANRALCTVTRESVDGPRAAVATSCLYPDGRQKLYFDELRMEESAWRVAPQFVRSEAVRDPATPR